MSQFFDRIMRALLTPSSPPEKSPAHTREWRAALIGSTVIEISTVAEYFYQQTFGHEQAHDWKVARDFPNVAPPFAQAFLEWKTPIRAETQFFHAEGMLWRATDVQTLARPHSQSPASLALRALIEKNAAAGLMAGHLGPETTVEEARAWAWWKVLLTSEVTTDQETFRLCLTLAPPTVRWYTEAWYFIETRQMRRCVGPLMCCRAPVTQDGKFLQTGKGSMFSIEGCATNFPNMQEKETLLQLGAGSYYPCLLAFSFLHCKNVTMQEHVPGKSLSAHHRRLSGQPLTTYYTLDIEPMKQVLRTEGQSETQGLKRALHMCRGHFAEYGPEFNKGKLFGKLEGRYWITEHQKGSAEHGVIDKEYRIKL